MPERASELPERLSMLSRGRADSGAPSAEIAAALGLAVVFTVSVAASAILHINQPPARRAVRTIATAALGKLFRGKIQVGEVESISLERVQLGGARILDPQGREVIDAHRLTVHVSTIELLRSLFVNNGPKDPIIIQFPRVQIEDAVVTLVPAPGTKAPSIGDAFIPRAAPTPSTGPGRPVDLGLPRIELAHVEVRGDVGVPLDGTVRHLVGAVGFSDDVVTVDVEPTGIAERAILPAEANGTAEYHLRVDTRPNRENKAMVTERDGTVRPKDPLDMTWNFNGSVGGVLVYSSGELEGSNLRADAELPKITPDGLHSVVPMIPLAREANATVRVRGILPDLAIATDLTIHRGEGIGTFVANGRVDLAGDPNLEVAFESSEIDPRDLIATLPETRVNGVGVVRMVAHPEGILASAEVTTQGTTAEGVAVPAMDIIVDLHDGSLVGSATLREGGLDADARFTVDPDGRVAFGVRAESEDLTQSPRLAALFKQPVAGGAAVDLSGSYDAGVVDVTGHASVGGLAAGPAGAARGYATFHVGGFLPFITVTSEAVLEEAHVADRKFDRVQLSVSGPLLKPSVALVLDDKDLGQITAHAEVGLLDQAAHDVGFKVERGGVTAEGKVAEVRISDAGLDANGIELSGTGLGSIAGSLRVDGGDVLGSLKGENLHLDKVASLLGVWLPIGGVANVDIAIERGAHGRKGHLELEVQDGSYSLLSGIAARVSATFDGDAVESAGFVRLVAHATDQERAEAAKQGAFTQAQLCDGPIAEVHVSAAKGHLSGPLLSAETWKRATGEADIAAENLDLRCIAALVPKPLLPVSEASGLVTTRVHFARRETDPYPSLEGFVLKTHGLEVVGPRAFFSTEAPWESRRVDAEVRGSLDGKSGHTDLRANFFDGTLLAEISTALDVDLGALFRAMRSPTDSAVAVLERAPIEAKVAVPRRSFADMGTLPSFLRAAIPPLDGDIRLDADLRGSLELPLVYASAQVFDVRPAAATNIGSEWVPSLDADVAATYTPEDGHAAIEAHMLHEGATVATVNAGVDVPIAAILHPTDAPLPWKAGMYVSLFGFPLESIPTLADHDVSGPVTGTLTLSGINARPTVALDLTATGSKLGEATFDTRIHGSLKPRTDVLPGADGEAPPPSRASDLSLEVHVEGEGGSSLDAIAEGGLAPDADGHLGADASRSGSLDVVMNDFELGALTPLVTPTLSRIGGTARGEIRVEMDSLDLSHLERGHITFPTTGLTPPTPGAPPDQPGVTIRDALVFIPQLGQELRGGKATIAPIAHPGRPEETWVEVSGLEAQGISGRVHGDLTAHFEGLGFSDAKGELAIDKGQEIPVTFEGVPLGLASGNFAFTAKHKPGTLEVDLHVPIARLDLPDSSSRNVQDLGDDPTIHMSELVGAPTTPRSADALRYELTVHLDRGEISGGFDAIVRSAPAAPITVSLSDQLVAGGEIQIESGSIELRQKKFEVDRGTVRLRAEDASNPYVNLTAHWEGPDGGRVFVDYVGNLKPITDDKIRFRSDPPRSKEDIIATLLFGTDLSSTPEGGAPAEAGNAGVGALAADVTSTLASQALKALVQSKYVSFSVDTTEGGNLRGRVEWKAAQGLTLGLSGEQVQANSATTTTTAQAAGAQGEVSLEWKFLPNWSLRSSFGAGVKEPTTGIDVVWQYNYNY